jgi:SH3-like domain-containing protein
MLRRSVTAFATIGVFLLLAPTPILAAKKKAAPRGIPKVVCSSPRDSKAAPSGAPKLILRVNIRANVRGGPATSYQRIWTATKHTPLEALCKYEAAYPGGTKETWYYVRDFEGFLGWVSASVIEEGRAVIVKVKQALARAGPGPGESAVWNLSKGYPLKVLGKRGKWYNVEDAEGEKAWIFEDVLWGSTD